MGYRRLVSLTALLVIASAVLPSASSAAPSCAEGPETVGTTIVGTPCADVIRLPRSVTTVFGEGGDDRLYGQRGNDSLFGGEGADRLYSGIGDDRLRGGPGDDLLSGGFGADSLDGEGGNDVARGDATIDAIGDSGGGQDTLSFTTGATPGFPNTGAFFTDAGFPAGAEGRGVYVDLDQGFANNGLAPSGGGVDGPLEPATDFADFETVIGSPFPDYLVGTTGTETFYGGGGADVIDGNGGGDVAHGGADGDGCVAVAVEDCELNDEEIDLRDPGAIVAGVMAPGASAAPALYLVGSDQDDRVTASYTPNAATPDPDDGTATFSLAAGSEGQFDISPSAAGGCAPPSGSTLNCSLADAPDSILLAGLDGDDVLLAPAFPEAVSVVLLGNGNADALTGGDTEDALIDGAGNDTAAGGGRDDALPNNGGADQLNAGPGEDLFVSNAVCDGDVLDGGADRDNANWANFGSGVAIDMGQEIAGLIGPQGEPRCTTAAQLTTLRGMEDIEGTNTADNLLGDPGPNQLLGRAGPDNYLAGAGNDLLLANSGDSDPTIDCGEGFDTALIDFTPANADGPPVGCESIEERPPNSFRPPDTPPDPEPEPPVTPPPPLPGVAQPPASGPERPTRRDRTPPATRIGRHPPSVLFAAHPRRSVTFAFTASERGARFRCRLDRQAFRPCRSPREYRVSSGRHVFRVLAIDAAGNHDRSPALFRFRVRPR
ncbi:MAG TPA: calcium-binding protein [Solirubrobacterales bacterium]|jgi:Ca2+-binding RTX toxin-like protein|nr:calcium-binding protein [Solirubrobacterales bacterium]